MGIELPGMPPALQNFGAIGALKPQGQDNPAAALVDKLPEIGPLKSLLNVGNLSGIKPEGLPPPPPGVPSLPFGMLPGAGALVGGPKPPEGPSQGEAPPLPPPVAAILGPKGLLGGV